MSGQPLLDAAVLDDLAAHIGFDAVRSIIEIFIGECRELAAIIGDAAATPKAAGRAAHSLKSSAGQLGAIALAAAALEVETAAEIDAVTLPQLVAELLDCAAQTETALATRLAG
jgi:HPt (histidine-containing phosphotransfer) domain-containing protein